MNRKNTLLKSILLVDDNEESLKLYSVLLKKKGKVFVKTTKLPSEAILLANKYFFDIVLIDVTINYNGTPLGGLEVYKSLKDRYGDSSLIVYSQFITDDWIENLGLNSNFIEKRDNPHKFIDETLEMMVELRKRQSCFIAMPFSPIYDELFKAIKRGVHDISYRCIRVDEQTFNKSIIENILLEIKCAKFVIFLATDKNPNAFYECGYAVALNKEVITVTDTYDNLPFDIRDRSAIAYGADMIKIKTLISDKLEKLTHIIRC